MIEVAVLLLVLVITVSFFGLFIAIYLLLKRITQIPVDFKIPIVTHGMHEDRAVSGFDRDSYTPDSADNTVPLDKFTPSSKQPLKVVYEDVDMITPQEEHATES